MKSISFTTESLPKSNYVLDADVVFIHSRTQKDVFYFIGIFPQYILFDSNDIVQEVFDSDGKKLVDLITDDITIFTLIKSGYLKNFRMTNVEGDKPNELAP